MIVRFHVVRKDNQAPVQGAKCTLSKGENVGITDSQGFADVETWWSGNLIYQIQAEGYATVSGTVEVPTSGSITFKVELGAFTAPEPTPPPGEQIIGTVGSACDILSKVMFNRSWFSYRQRYTGYHWVWDSEADDAYHAASRNPDCYLPAPPPPKTVDEVSKEVDILRDTIHGVSQRIENIATSLAEGFASLTKSIEDLAGSLTKRIDELQKGLDAIWDKLEVWLVERIIDIIIKAANRDLEQRSKK